MEKELMHIRKNPIRASSGWRCFTKRLYRYRYLYLVSLSALAFMIIFHYVPLYGIQIAFRKFRAVDGIWGSQWVGLTYFTRMFREETFLQVFRNTLIISGLKMFISFPSGVLFALILNEVRNTKVKRTVQTISYMPHFLSWVVIAGVIKSILSLNGPINILLDTLGLDKVMFLTKSSFFRPTVIITDIWKNMGWSSIVYLAAITGIPREQYESSQIDGASRIQQMLYITLPSILPMVSVMFLMRIGRIVNAGFDQIFNLYNPLVYDVGDILDTYVYRVGLKDMNFSYSTAIGLFKNVLGVILLLIMNNVTKRMGNDNAGI